MAATPSESQVRVAVRIRPLTSRETSEGGKVVVDGNAFDRTVSLSKRKFTFDSVFHPKVTQPELYSNVAPQLLEAFLGGYNATVIAYGQTGSGKTYTMGSEAGGFSEENSRNLCDNVGLIPRFTSDLFSSLVQMREESEKALLRNWEVDNGSKRSVSLINFRVSASFLEVYGEDIYDLLDNDRNPLKIREGSNKDVCVTGLKCVPINDSSEAMNILNTGTLNRTTASTLMNLTSSRSHACFTVNLHQTTRSADGDELITTSHFTFVDLAGSERMKKTGAEGDRAKEGIKINEGLLALGNVINALADEERLTKGGRVHVPYRQSKLTRLLQDALGGNSQTLFLACVSPSDTNVSETLSTLHYANRARNIKNAPTRGVDAAAEELRMLRTLTNILKCELVKQRFKDGSSSIVAEPEVERSNESSHRPQDIGVVNEGLLLRNDVISYLKMIEEKASQLSGSRSLPSSDQTISQSFLVTPPRSQEFSAIDKFDRDYEGHDDSDGSDIDVSPDEEIEIADELLLETQHEDQLSKIDGDIEEQEERLLQLKKRTIEYRDMKEKYELLTNEVQKLEAEKQELIDKLEKAQSGEGSSWIKSKLDQVKASLVRARLDVRKQQQKCRDAELNAHRCKGLEIRIEEMKNIKANLIKKHQDDAKRQRDFSKTKAREIQDARKRENAARKIILKLEAENTRLKANLERSRARQDDLSKKLKETESNLKAFSTRRTNKPTSDVETTIFAPSNARTDSIKHVLDKAVSDRVALTQNRLVYKSKVALRESLFHSMTTEAKILNYMKREREAMENGHLNELSADIKDREENLQDFLIQMELVEKNLEELQAKFPRIEDDTDDIFDEHEPTLKMLSKLNGSDLRNLLLRFLRSTYSSELDRKGLKDALLKKDLILRTKEDEFEAQKGKVVILTKSLEKHQREEFYLKEKIKHLEKEREGNSPQVIARIVEQPSTSHAQELKNLRKELELSYSKEIQRVLALAEETRLAEVSRITNELNESHDLEIEKAIRERVDHKRSEIDVSTSPLPAAPQNDMLSVQKELLPSMSESKHAKEAGSTSDEQLEEGDLHMAEKRQQIEFIGETLSGTQSRVKLINGLDVLEMTQGERLASDSRHVSAPQDEDRRSHSLSIDTSRGGTIHSSGRWTPMSARSSSSSIVPTFSKFDSLKQRYLKKVRETPRLSDSVN